MNLLSIAPRILTVDNALSSEYCDSIIASNLDYTPRPANVVRNGKEEFIYDKSLRDTDLFIDQGDLFQHLQDTAVSLLNQYNYRKEVFESRTTQRYFWRYAPGQFLNSHHDEIDYLDKRAATALFYLNDDFTGGETYFNLLNITVEPKKGRCLLFYYDYDENPDLTRLTLHQGNTVTSGTKYVATVFWVRPKEKE